MRPFAAGWQAALADVVLPLAWGWKVTRLDGVVKGFTTHVADITIGGVLYSAASGFLVTNVESGDSLAVDNLEIEGALSSTAIRAEDLRAGLYDSAALEIFFFNFENPALPPRLQFVGTIGAVTHGDLSFTASQRGLTQPLTEMRGRLVSNRCDAVLGDSRCRVDLTPYRRSGTIASPVADRIFTDTARNEADGWWAGGNFTVVTGLSAGLKMEIKRSTSLGVIELVLPLLSGLAAGDTYSMTPGCNHLLKMAHGTYTGDCKVKFFNTINFPEYCEVPGPDAIVQYGGRSGV